MTLREYLITCDEFERTIILANISRRCPDYDSYGPSQKKKALKELSKMIRKDGVLAIEEQVSQMENQPFLKKGLELIIDGVDSKDVQEILEIELNEREKVYGNSVKIFKLWGSYAPAFGMVGTLIGLIQMLSDMGSPDDIASGMSVALITTLYGALFTNMLFNPIGFNIESKGETEIEYLEMVVCGLSSIQNGDSNISK